MLEIFQYSFMVRALQAGLIVGLICPLIGIFLVLRRYSLMADTLAHVSLAGVAIGLITKINPFITALITTIISSIAIEKLRETKRVYGESALALFLSGSLALAIVLISLARGFNADLFGYLFGSITTVQASDLGTISILGIAVIGLIVLFYKELVYISFDEETARVSGVPTKFINSLLIILTATTIAISLRIVGVLLISGLMVIPVTAALQLKKGFLTTIIFAEIISLFSVIVGIFASYYLNLAAGGAIVLVTLIIFSLTNIIVKSS
ncbi:metal ABC transporter permease [Candidatus Daviesbacteria bacterium]|nr:metal ABC transporter permease [Candidatus Daviesbacteria bacterium]